MVGTASPAAGYGSDGVYRSPRPAAPIPSDPALSLSDFVLSHAAVSPSALALVDAATGRALTFEALLSVVIEVEDGKGEGGAQARNMAYTQRRGQRQSLTGGSHLSGRTKKEGRNRPCFNIR
jgi:hypothetical protein